MPVTEYTLPLSLLTPSPQTFPVCSTKIIKKIHINKLYGLKIKYFLGIKSFQKLIPGHIEHNCSCIGN
jgi:hypothetical protein